MSASLIQPRWPRTRVPHIPDFLWSLVGSANFMRLSLKKGAQVVLSGAACRKFGVSRSFFARCGGDRWSPLYNLDGYRSQCRGIPHLTSEIWGTRVRGKAIGERFVESRDKRPSV